MLQPCCQQGNQGVTPTPFPLLGKRSGNMIISFAIIKLSLHGIGMPWLLWVSTLH